VAKAFPCRIEASSAAIALLDHLDATGAVALDHRTQLDGRLVVVLTEDEIARVEAVGLAVERDEPLVVRAQRSDGGGAPDAEAIATGFVTGYLDAAQVAAGAAALAAEFPTLATLTTLPHATSGYDGSSVSLAGPAAVQLLRITSDPSTRSRPGFLLIAGTHAREWMNPLIVLEFAEQLLRNYDPASADPDVVAVTRIVDEADVLIIPVLNPDGLNFSVHDDAGWRKNRRTNAGTPACPGVDNNRNYEAYFGGAGSSNVPCTETYRGASAFSERENLNVRHVLEEFPNILVGNDAHSSGPQILRPQPGGGSFIASLPVSSSDEAIYASLQTTLRNAIQAVNGTAYATGSSSNHAGTSDEYMFFAHRVFGFNTECGTSFQPPWPTAHAVIAEVASGMRALANATADLTTTTPTPVAVAQCLDRTGSMVAFGYEGLARANAKRFADMMSLGDRTAIVSFADPSPDPAATPPGDRSVLELPLTLLDDPGDAATVRAAIDGIAFGGWTPIGAGLERAAAVLAAAPDPKAVLLLSDGFENRTPTVASALASWPAGLRVFSVALGPAADAPLLQQIATQTGGTFQTSPTAVDLHAVYNQMRGDITDDGLVLNDLAADDAPSEHVAEVEPSADRLTVSVSGTPGREPALTVVAPSGREVRADDWGVRLQRGDGYALAEVDRPAPGAWRIEVEKLRGPHVVAAFVTSPLHVEFRLPSRAKPPQEAAVRARASFDGRPLDPPRVAATSRAVPAVELPRPREPGDRGWTDTLDPKRVAELARPKTGRLVRWPRGRAPALPPGFSRVRVEARGALPGGAPYRRVALRTIRV
jgi:hypothetical protein